MQTTVSTQQAQQPMQSSDRGPEAVLAWSDRVDTSVRVPVVGAMGGALVGGGAARVWGFGLAVPVAGAVAVALLNVWVNQQDR